MAHTHTPAPRLSWRAQKWSRSAGCTHPMSRQSRTCSIGTRTGTPITAPLTAEAGSRASCQRSPSRCTPGFSVPERIPAEQPVTLKPLDAAGLRHANEQTNEHCPCERSHTRKKQKQQRARCADAHAVNGGRNERGHENVCRAGRVQRCRAGACARPVQVHVTHGMQSRDGAEQSARQCDALAASSGRMSRQSTT